MRSYNFVKLALFCVVLLALSVAASVARAATTSGTVTFSNPQSEQFEFVVYDVLSDASGYVVDNSTSAYGYLERVTIVPDSGATSPTANYDVEIRDVTGVDILLGLGEDRSASASEVLLFDQHDGVGVTSPTATLDTNHSAVPWRVPVHGKLQLYIDDMGAANGCQIWVVIRKE
ncbi:MAG: hypothetical protein ACOCVH_02050 [Verrucomicrobiota bacterium]